MVVVAAILCWLLLGTILPSNFSLIFLTAVLFSALRYGLWPSIFASLLSELVWNFFFLPPRFTLTIDDPRDLLALILFLIVSIMVSNLAALKNRQGEALRTRAEAADRLYDFTQKIAAAGSTRMLLSVASQAIGAMVDCGVCIALKDVDGGMDYAKSQTAEINRDAIAACLAAGRQDAGAPEAWHIGQAFCWRTLRGLSHGAGLVAITRTPDELSLDNRRLLAMTLEQTVIAIERLALARSVERANLEAEKERLRSAMLTSLSHDLRTPLTVIMATHATLKTLTPSYDPAIKVELLDRAQAEAERLNRFIGNLLDMTRLESGDLNIALAPIDVMETVEAALERAAPLMMGRPVIVDIPADLPMARADFLLLEQVIFNLLDNAAKYAPGGGSITISSRGAGDFVTIEIMDEGPGIAPESRAAIFDKFTRLRREDRQRPGTGLGLAICRGFLRAMDGQITVRNRTDRSGAIFAVTLGKIDIAAEIRSRAPVL